MRKRRIPPTLDQKIARAKAKLAGLEHEKNVELSRTLVTCENGNRGCGAKLPIGDLTFIQTLWYERPSGCADGDRWHNGEGQFDCPKCGLRNKLYDRKEIEALKYRFKNIVEEHDKS